MNRRYHLDEAEEGKVYEIISVHDANVCKDIGIAAGMTTIVLKKALLSIVQFGYAQFEMEHESLKKIEVAPV